MKNLPTQSQKGISLIEILVVLAVIGFLSILIASIPNAINSISQSRNRSIAKDVATKQLNVLRQVGYTNLSNTQTTFTDSNLSQLSNSSGTYSIEDCPASICTNNELLKKVTVSVSWQENNNPKKVEFISFVGQGGIGQ